MSISTSGHSDILVVGGGVIGLACAYYLARSGQTVRIIEQETMGAGASHGYCGLLFVSDLPRITVFDIITGGCDRYGHNWFTGAL